MKVVTLKGQTTDNFWDWSFGVRVWPLPLGAVSGENPKSDSEKSRWTLRRVAVLSGVALTAGAVGAMGATGVIPVETVLHGVGNFATTHGPIGVGAAVGTESLGLPVPGEATLIGVAGANHGNMLAWPEIVGTAWAAATTGTAIQYAAGRAGGNALVKHLSDKRQSEIKMARCFFEDGGKWVVSGGRFIPGVRSYIGLVSGMSGMSFPKFMAWNAIGAAAWTGFWGTAAFFTGNLIDNKINDVVSTVRSLPVPCLAVAGVGLAAGAAFGIYKLHKKLDEWKESANYRIPGRMENLPKNFAVRAKKPNPNQLAA